MNEELNRSIDAFVDLVQSCAEYQEYEKQKKIIEDYPELKEEINEFRVRNFAIQTMENAEEIYDAVDSFERDFAHFWEDSRVADFLNAEMAYCKLIQEIDDKMKRTISVNF